MNKHAIKLLSGIGLALSFTLVHAGVAITGINVSKTDGDEQILQLTFDGPVPKPNSFAISNPPRIALDFADTDVKLSSTFTELGNPLVRSAVAVSSNGRSRVVLNLSKNASYSTRVSNNTLLISLNSNLQAEQRAAAPLDTTPASPSTMAVATSRIPLALDFRRGSSGSGRVEINLPSNDVPVDIKRQGKNIVVDILGSNLPPGQDRKLDVTDFGTPVGKIDAMNQGKNSRIVIQPQGDWDYSSYQTDRKLVVEVKKLSADQKAQNELEKPVYKGDKLSLNFQDIEIRTVLQVIAEFTGLNIVTSDSVSGKITLRLKDVPWDQALDLILDSKGLDKRRTGNIIRIAPREELMARDKQAFEAKNQLTTLEPLRSETFVLRYRSAEDFKKILEEDSKGGTGSGRRNTLLSERGSALIDPKTNTLIINDTSTVIDKIRDLIEKTDTAVKQVLIEARIVEASDNFSRELGVKLSYDRVGRLSLGGSLSNVIDNAGRAAGKPYVVQPGVNVPITGTPAGTIGALYRAGASNLIGLELQALQTESKGKIIASPRVLTSDRSEATIEQGQEIPYQEASSSGATSTSFKKAVLSLKVKPQITPDNTILMDIQINKDSADFANLSGGVPSLKTKKVNTQVLVENGGTVVIGGIYTQDQSDGVTKVPLLGDIPLLGALFRSRSKQDDRTELLVFLTPRVVDNLNPGGQ
ncbi:type IV pilus secretin PilQ [Pseudogulbenkiania sp. MAI-1]|uniref:type IV pilus secretin PilQ n=1 Tax=Pseudogulbenkiania sp. MAI-1 TaxID=990370 RepID=UPI00045E761E|nr:type IV pilus secretin PilQ [Pseudogulbenkiania sp. MAI-1]